MSIIPAPPRKSLIINKKPRSNKLYTIHNYTHNPFILRNESKEIDNSSIDSTIISFKREIDAISFAQMIESHKALTKEWPSTTLGNMNSLFVMANMNENPLYYPNELYLKTWDLSELQIYCASNILQLFIMHSITLKDENVYNIKGEHLTLSIPIEKYSEILEIMFLRSKGKDINDEWDS
jgi:hypothetical protein